MDNTTRLGENSERPLAEKKKASEYTVYTFVSELHVYF